MHPNLSPTCPLHRAEESNRLTLTQALVLAGVWIGFFAVGYALLP